MRGQMPTTVLEGLLSGISHPAIGLDHLTFIFVLGMVAAMISAGVAMIASFVVAATVGVLIHAANVEFLLSEQLVSVSVVMAGVLLVLGLGARQLIWLPFSTVAGLLHGYAFGETTLGADWIVVAAYIAGVVLFTSVVAGGIMLATSKVLRLPDAYSIQIRSIGAVVACIGIYLLVSLLRAD